MMFRLNIPLPNNLFLLLSKINYYSIFLLSILTLLFWKRSNIHIWQLLPFICFTLMSFIQYRYIYYLNSYLGNYGILTSLYFGIIMFFIATISFFKYNKNIEILTQDIDKNKIKNKKLIFFISLPAIIYWLTTVFPNKLEIISVTGYFIVMSLIAPFRHIFDLIGIKLARENFLTVPTDAGLLTAYIVYIFVVFCIYKIYKHIHNR